MIGGMKASPTANPRTVGDTAPIHLALAAVFGVGWILSGLHLLVLMHREVFEHRAQFILVCAAPPLLPFYWLASGSLSWAAYGLLAIAVVAVPW